MIGRRVKEAETLSSVYMQCVKMGALWEPSK